MIRGKRFDVGRFVGLEQRNPDHSPPPPPRFLVTRSKILDYALSSADSIVLFPGDKGDLYMVNDKLDS